MLIFSFMLMRSFSAYIWNFFYFGLWYHLICQLSFSCRLLEWFSWLFPFRKLAVTPNSINGSKRWRIFLNFSYSCHKPGSISALLSGQKTKQFTSERKFSWHNPFENVWEFKIWEIVNKTTANKRKPWKSS